MQIIDGAAVAAQIRAEIRAEVETLPRPPGLATVLVGDDPASHSYVRAKRKACAELGIRSIHHELAASVDERALTGLLDQLAVDPDVHGILVQLPLPKHLDEARVMAHLPRHKNVDGFDPVDIGSLGMKGKRPMFEPCTPAGCIELLARSGVQIAGSRAVVLGRSNIVGLPVSLMLLSRDATVTICHSKTPELASYTRNADILIAAIGRARFVTTDMVSPGTVVIDVGVNRVADSSKKAGYALVGDVDFEAVAPLSRAITPVPGGVGPMTIAMLMRNTLHAAKQKA